MNLRICATVLVFVFALAACGQKGDKGDSTVTFVTPTAQPATVTEKPAADLVLVNIPTDPNKSTVVPGERNIRLAGFEFSRKFNSRPPIQLMVFENMFPFSGNSLDTIKEFQVFDGDGNDIKREAVYNVIRDDANRRIIVDFYQSAWYPNDWGIIPEQYSLMGQGDPNMMPGTKFRFKIAAVQLHGYNLTADFSDVVGGAYTVTASPGADLPVITTASASTMVVSADMVGKSVYVGNFTATCLPGNKYGCTFNTVKFKTSGLGAPTMSIGPVSWNSSADPYPDYNSFSAKVGHGIGPGLPVTFSVYAVALQENIWITVSDMSWSVAGDWSKVNPRMPPTPSSCGLIVSDNKGDGCKG